jgi:hypothetical protein
MHKQEKKVGLFHDILLNRIYVNGTINGLYSNINFIQEYFNNTRKKVDINYGFPISEKRVVKLYRIETNNGIIETEVNRNQFEQKTDIFSITNGYIKPNNKCIIAINYDEELICKERKICLIIPVSIGVKNYTDTVLDKRGSVEILKIMPPVINAELPYRFYLELEINTETLYNNVYSPTHEIDIDKKSDKKFIVTLKNFDIIPDTDFVIEYSI